MEQFSEGYLDLGSVNLHYVEAGSGPLVILYHGFPSCWVSFYYQILDLQADYHVIAVDGPGANLSSKPADLDAYRLPNLADQVDRLARHHAGDERFTLIGHDWGGALAWAYAQEYPDRLDRVVGISAPPPNQLLALLESSEDQRNRSRYMWDMRDGERHRAMTANGGKQVWKYALEPLRALPQYTDEIDEVFRQAFAMPGAIDGGINWYRANIPLPGEFTDKDFWPSRDAVTDVPGLLIWGDDDQVFVPEFIDGLADYVKDLSVCRLPETRHWPMIERHERVNREIRNFLKG